MLDVDVRCDEGGCSVVRTEAIPIANYIDEHTEMVVARMSDLADGTVKLSPTWRAYYAKRLALMRVFLLGLATSYRFRASPVCSMKVFMGRSR